MPQEHNTKNKIFIKRMSKTQSYLVASLWLMTPLSVITSLRRSSRCTFPCMTHKHSPVSHQLHANTVPMLAFDAMQISAESSKQLYSLYKLAPGSEPIHQKAQRHASPSIHPRCLKTQQIKTGMQMPLSEFYARLKGARLHTHTDTLRCEHVLILLLHTANILPVK